MVINLKFLMMFLMFSDGRMSKLFLFPLKSLLCINSVRILRALEQLIVQPSPNLLCHV